MRIRSVKYRSASKNDSHQQLPSRGLIFSRAQAISTDNLPTYAHLGKQSAKNLTTSKFYKTLQTTFQTSNFRETQPYEIKKNSFFVSKPQEKSAKGRTFYQKDRNLGFDKENRSSYLKLRVNVWNKGQQGKSIKLGGDTRTQKIGLKIDNFNQKSPLISQQQEQQAQQQVQNRPQQTLTILTDSIIRGQNLTYGIDTLQKDIQQVQQGIMIQKVKIDKIRGQMGLIAPRVKRELENIVMEFRKGADGLWARLSKEKSEKCTELVNWKGVIEAKSEEYQGQFEFMNTIHSHFEKVAFEVGLKMPKSSPDEINQQQ